MLVAQPRPSARAVSVARRVAEVFGESVGHTVGYAVRGDNRVCSRRTRLTFLTTGALLRRLAADPELRGVSHVFVDEIHERTADADFLLAHLRNLLVTRWFSPNARVTGHTELVSGANGRTATDSDRNEPTVSHSEGSLARASPPTPLRVVLMSATMASSDLRDYFRVGVSAERAGDPDAAHRGTRVPGRGAIRGDVRFGVRAERIESAPKNAKTKTRRIVLTTRSTRTRARWSRRSPPVLAELENVAGASALVFLPGAPEIARLQQTLRASLPGALTARLHVVPLHGQIAEEQRRRRPGAVRHDQAGFSDERRRDFADHSGRRRRLRQRALEEARVRRENPTLCLTTRMVLARLRRAEERESRARQAGSVCVRVVHRRRVGMRTSRSATRPSCSRAAREPGDARHADQPRAGPGLALAATPRRRRGRRCARLRGGCARWAEGPGSGSTAGAGSGA